MHGTVQKSSVNIHNVDGLCTTVHNGVMNPAELLRKCLLDARIEGEGIRRFEERLGFPEGSLRELINEQKPQVPRLDKAAKIAEALGLELYLGPPRANDPSASSTIFGALQSPEVRSFETAVDADGYVGLKISGREWSGILLLPPDLSKDLGVSLTYRSMQIEEQD